MILLRLSGHSGAGKTRLVEALQKFGVSLPRVLRYTSRPARVNEFHGQDYYFMSRAFIASLPEEDFLVGQVRNILQAFDLVQLKIDLETHELVLIEIYPDLWPKLLDRMSARLGERLSSASVFMTAVDPGHLSILPDDEARSDHISREVEKILLHRGKDEIRDIRVRSRAAAREVMEALANGPGKPYDRILFSAPEGPDGEDDWTREGLPVGFAKSALEEFIAFCTSLKAYRANG
jgi:hypothetical protein